MTAAAPLEHCPKCNGLIPPDELRCVRCGFELARQTKLESGESFGASKAAADNTVSSQPSWGTIWAEEAKKRKSRRWRIFPVACLAWFAYLVSPVPINWSDGGGLSFIALLSLIMALPTTYLLNLIWSIGKAMVEKKESEGGWPAAARSARRINWTKVFAVVFTSNVFFLTSFIGMVAAYESMLKMGGQYVESGVNPYDRMVVIAVVPNPAKQGTVQVVQVPLRNMEKFKAANPTHSFLLPLGSGRVQETAYEVQPVGDGKVLVETKFSQEMGGLLIMRYEATDKSVRPIFTNNVQFLMAIWFGLALAIFLYLIGGVLQYWAAKHAGAPVTPNPSP